MLSVSIPALSLTIVCALGFAACDYFRKVASESISSTLLLTIFVTGQVPLLGIWVLATNSFSLQIGYWPYGLVTGLAALFANLFFIMAVRMSPLSLTIPILALIPVFTTIFGAIALNEIPGRQQILGILISVIGLLTLYLPSGNLQTGDLLHRFKVEAGSKYMLIVAILWSATAPLDKMSMGLSSPATHAFIQVCMIAAVMITYVVTSRQLTKLMASRHNLTAASLASLSAGIAYGCQLVAYQLTMISVVESLKRVIGVLSALILGSLLLKENLTKQHFLGIILVCIGVPLIILPKLW